MQGSGQLHYRHNRFCVKAEISRPDGLTPSGEDFQAGTLKLPRSDSISALGAATFKVFSSTLRLSSEETGPICGADLQRVNPDRAPRPGRSPAGMPSRSLLR